MSIGEPKFDKPEEQGLETESEAELMSPEAAKQILENMDEYVKGLKADIEEKRKELEVLKQNPDANGNAIAELAFEIYNLEEQLGGLEIFSEEGKEVLEQGGEFFDRKVE
ncbi:MAG: hypothetical protein Q7R61_00035 [bacterium]|nr:hypothetical protein [bacterium]